MNEYSEVEKYTEITRSTAALTEQVAKLDQMCIELNRLIGSRQLISSDLFELEPESLKSQRRPMVLQTLAVAAKVAGDAHRVKDELVDIAITETDATDVAIQEASGVARSTLGRKRKSA